MNSLYIGLGGIGGWTLRELIAQKQNNQFANDKFVFIDTDEINLLSAELLYIDKIGTEFQLLFSPEHVVTLHLGKESPTKMLSSFSNVPNWYDAPANNDDLTEGTKGVRQYARLAFKYHMEDIRRTLIPLLREVHTHKGRVYVVTSAFGGTGSGIYLDLLYLIDKTGAYLGEYWERFDVRLIMAVNSTLSWDFNTNAILQLNQFAALDELNAVCKDVAPSNFEKYYIDSDLLSPNVGFWPFRFCYLFDGPYMNWSDEVIPQMADAISNLEIIAFNGADVVLGNNVHSYWRDSLDEGLYYIKAFCSVGCYSIEKPGYLLKEYFAHRLLFDVFHKGLLGSSSSVDKAKVETLAREFLAKIDKVVKVTCDEMSDSVVSEQDFIDETATEMLFSSFIQDAHYNSYITEHLTERKNKMLNEVRDTAYGQCWQWLHEYDFFTIFEALKLLDTRLYAKALQSSRSMSHRVYEALEESHGFWGRFNKNKAIEAFEQLLGEWLYYEACKALSSGRSDIKDKDSGYLDHCKEFVFHAMEMHLPKDNEQWESIFTKQVAQLKLREDKCYFPSLDSLTDDEQHINPMSAIVELYEKGIMVVDDGKASFENGTCTPSSLHKIILERISADKELKRSGIDIDQLFDPTPGHGNNLNDKDAVQRFIYAYVRIAEQVIAELISNNQYAQRFIADDIVSSLFKLPEEERNAICKTYADYDKTNLCVMTGGRYYDHPFVFHINGKERYANPKLENVLGLYPLSFEEWLCVPACRDKIMKLIVRIGYGVDDSRAFDYSSKLASRLMNPVFNPYIDKRFVTDRKPGESLADMFAREAAKDQQN